MADHHHQQQQQQPALPPGFRFHPTDEELILHYLRNRAASAPCPVPIIADVDIYKFDPWDLPAKAAYGDGEYYFFSPRDRKYPNGIRPNRAAGSGYWKATGTDKPIHDAGDSVVVGVKKALVFYRGRPPRGSKTNWIMHEYRLISSNNNANAAAAAAAGCYPRPPSKFRNVSMRLDDWVLCRIYKKSGQASPMVPPLADYDHLDHDEPSSGGGFDDDVFFCGLTTSSSSALVMPPHHQQAAEPLMMTTRLPKIPSLSDLFDEYALAQIFDTAAPAPAADHAPLAVHPSLNQLLAVGESDSDLVYCSPAAPAPGGPVKRSKRAMVTDECAGGGLEHPPPPAKRLSVGSSCFDVAPQRPTAAAASVLGGLSHQYHNNHMLPQF